MKKTVCFVGATILLIFTTAFCVAGTVQSQSSKKMKLHESYYQQLEQEYVEEMREYLTDEGFINCGIMLTRTVCEDGSRQYQVTIHNSRFDRLTVAEKAVLQKDLEERAFAEENCFFTHSLTGNA